MNTVAKRTAKPSEPDPIKCRYCGNPIGVKDPSRECSGGYMHKDCFKEHWEKVDRRISEWRRLMGSSAS